MSNIILAFCTWTFQNIWVFYMMYQSDKYACFSVIKHDSILLFSSGIIIFAILSCSIIYYDLNNLIKNFIFWVILVCAMYATLRSLNYNDSHWWHWIQFIVLSTFISFTTLGICVKTLVNIFKEVCDKKSNRCGTESGISLSKIWKFICENPPKSEVMREY